MESFRLAASSLPELFVARARQLDAELAITQLQQGAQHIAPQRQSGAPLMLELFGG